MRVDVDAHQTVAAGTHPDITAAVAGHCIDAEVDTGAGKTQLVADGGVPSVGLLVVDEECSLAIEPDVVELVGEGFQRVGVAQMPLCYFIVFPRRGLLSADVTANDASIAVDYECTVETLTDRAHLTLRDGIGIVGIAELVDELLLHVVADNAFVGDVAPEVLLAVDIDDRRQSVDAETCEDLTQVAFEALRLWVVDAVSGSRLYPQLAAHAELNAFDVTVRQR